MLSSEYRRRRFELIKRKSCDEKYIEELSHPVGHSDGYRARPPSSMRILGKVASQRTTQYISPALEVEAANESGHQGYVAVDALSGEREGLYIAPN